jgi:hypothetical protein
MGRAAGGLFVLSRWAEEISLTSKLMLPGVASTGEIAFVGPPLLG